MIKSYVDVEIVHVLEHAMRLWWLLVGDNVNHKLYRGAVRLYRDQRHKVAV